MSNNKSEFSGNILSIRAVEDSIRATKKYTEGVRTMFKKHPMQGTDFPSPVFCKLYEVYPDMEVSWDMPIGNCVEWLSENTLCIDVIFHYDYRGNMAFVEVIGGAEEVRKLAEAIPGFSDTLAMVIVNGSKSGEKTIQ